MLLPLLLAEIMALSIDLRLDTVFLAGGDHEYSPYACVRGNWSGARESMRTPELKLGEWVHVGDVPTPPPGRLLHVNLYSHSSYSGIPEIDEQDKGHTSRQPPAATTSFELVEGERTSPLIDHYVAMDTFRKVVQAFAGGAAMQSLSNPAAVIGQEKLKFAEQAALNYALKGEVSIRLRGKLPVAAPPVAVPSAAFFEKLDAAYWLRTTDLPLPTGADASQRFPFNPTEPLVEQLHLVQWDTPQGRLMPVAFARRAPPSAPDPKFVEMQLVSAMLRHGMRPQSFRDTIEKQFAQPLRVLSSTLTCMEVLENYAAFPSNSIQYGSDRRYPNLEFLKKQTPDVQRLLAPQVYGESSGTTKTPALSGVRAMRSTLLSRLAGGTLNALLSAKYGRVARTAAHLAGGSKKEALPLSFEEKCAILVESWDATAHAGETNTGDCEDSGFGGLTPLEALRSVKSTSPTIKTAQRFLALFHVWGTGSTVTAAYLKEDPPAHIPMPIVGSPEDKDFSEGGHAYAGLEPRPRFASKQLRGLQHLPLHKDDAVAARRRLELDVKTAPAFAKLLPVMFLEGTAPGLRFPLPAEETYAGTDRADLFLRRAATRIAFLRACKTKATPLHETIGKFARVPSQTYELWAMKDPKQRVSSFYRTVLWVLHPDAVTPQLEQCVTINVKTRHRGVTVADYARDAVDGGTVALVGPYADVMSAREWKATVQPYHDYMMEQQPVSCWGKAGTPSSLTGRVSSVAQLRQLASPMTVTPLSATTSPVSKADSSVLRMFERADEGDVHVVLPLYTPAWKFAAAGPAKTNEFIAALDTLKKNATIVEYIVIRDAPMSHLPEQVEILLLLPVCATIDEKLFPKT